MKKCNFLLGKRKEKSSQPGEGVVWVGSGGGGVGDSVKCLQPKPERRVQILSTRADTTALAWHGPTRLQFQEWEAGTRGSLELADQPAQPHWGAPGLGVPTQPSPIV